MKTIFALICLGLLTTAPGQLTPGTIWLPQVDPTGDHWEQVAICPEVASLLRCPNGSALKTWIQDSGNVATFQKTTITTNAAGEYTWTYPTAYPVGTKPTVGVTVEGPATYTYNHVATAVTNTSMTVKVTRSRPVTVLSISVMGVESAAATTVHLMAAPGS